MAEAELDSFRIVGDTTIGWDANTPVNETVDDDGNFVGSGGSVSYTHLTLPTNREV